MKQIILIEVRCSSSRVLGYVTAITLITLLAFLRVGAAEITAMVILLREFRRWNH